MAKRRLAAAALMGLAGWLAWVRRPKSYPDPRTLITYRGNPQERLIALKTLPNLRDFGGYPTQDGRQVRRGLLYRSAALGYLSDDDLQALNRLGLKLVCDLRTAEEVEAVPDRLPTGADSLHLPAHAQQAQSARLQSLFGMLLQRGYLEKILPRLYIEVMIEQNAQVFAAIFRRVADGDLPILIHCTAGKDRTGLSAALLLHWLGVDEDSIIQDYSLSNLFYEDFMRFSGRILAQLGKLGIRTEETYPLMIADPRTLQQTFDHIRARYGSVAHYLRGPAQLDEATLQAVRERLLE